VRVLVLSAAALCLGSLWGAAEEQLSLAERAEAAKAANGNRTKTSTGRVLTNDDLKKAKGNVIFLSPSPTPPPLAHPSPVSAGLTPVSVSEVLAPSDLVRQLDENRGRALRLRAAVEQAQRDLVDAAPADRPAVEQRLREALDELMKTSETIGTLSERSRPSGATPPEELPTK